MANLWNVWDIDTRKKDAKIDSRKYYEDEENLANYIKASFNKWTDKTPEEITILESPIVKGEFFHANYCLEQDAIEVHFIVSENFKGGILKIENSKQCIVRCTKVIFIRHFKQPTNDELKESKCKNEPINQPERKKGSIIVGNP